MTEPLRIGILGAAKIAPIAIINPARTRNDVTISCVAAREPSRAHAFAQQYGIPGVAPSYAALLERDDVDLVYVALPAGAHAEWTVRALEAGKAVLCEKPFAMSAGEARQMVDAGRRAARPLLEAFHYRHHIVLRRLFGIVASGELGELKRTEAAFDAPIAFTPTELRWISPLGGGALMDLGTYCVHVLRTIAGEEPAVIAARCEMQHGVDALTQAELRFPGGLSAELHCSMIPERFRSRLWIEGSRGSLEIANFVAPHLGCKFNVTIDGVDRSEPVEGDSTFCAQLAHVVDALKGVCPPLTGGEDAISNMQAIDSIYRTAGVR